MGSAPASSFRITSFTGVHDRDMGPNPNFRSAISARIICHEPKIFLWMVDTDGPRSRGPTTAVSTADPAADLDDVFLPPEALNSLGAVTSSA